MKRPGRPREFDQVVSVRLPAELHDQLSRAATVDRCDLSKVIRDRLEDSFVSQNSTSGEKPRDS